MSFLDDFFGSAPGGQTSSSATQTNLPDWYLDATRGLAARATEAAGAPRPIYTGQQTAGFTPDQLQAMQMVKNNVGSYQPTLNAAAGNFNGAAGAAGNYFGQAANAGNAMVGQAGQAGNDAMSAVGGPAQAWTDPGTFQKYMSPYTQSVTDEIARLGTRNMMENILPAANQAFVGSGGFGSTRNSGALARAMRDTQSDILGKQAMSLESGYKTASDIFGSDATRAQGQGKLQADTALGAGALTNTAGANLGNILNTSGANIGNIMNTAGSGLSNLATTGQTLQNNDVNAMAGVGALQQGLNQKQLDNQYADFKDASGYDMGQAGKLADILKGMDVKTQQSVTNAGSDPGSKGAIDAITAILAGIKGLG